MPSPDYDAGRKPRLLDLFCGAGGCSVGYHRAGFDVVGVDNKPHPDYPFPMVVTDAMVLLGVPAFLQGFDVVHASPPCPRYSVATHARGNAHEHPDLVMPVREALRAWGGVYIIENVPGAPLENPALVCGWAMGMKHIKRHRLFESNAPLMSPGRLCPKGDTVSVFGHSGEDRRRSAGGVRKHVPISEVRELMGVNWMSNRDDVSDSIPPAYTEYLGGQLLDWIGTGMAGHLVRVFPPGSDQGADR